MSTVTETNALRLELAQLTDRVGSLERRLGFDSATMATVVDVESLLPAVRQITEELFPGRCEFTEEFDPEYPDDRYTVVNVETTGGLKEIAERGCKWDERIRLLSDNLFGRLRLLISPR